MSQYDVIAELWRHRAFWKTWKSVEGLSTRTVRVCGVDNVEDNGNAIVAQVSEVHLYNGASGSNFAAFSPKVEVAHGRITVDAGDSVVAKIDGASGLLQAIGTEDMTGDNQSKFHEAKIWKKCPFSESGICPIQYEKAWWSIWCLSFYAGWPCETVLW